MISCFPDNTVLCNFASVSRLDILENVLSGRGRWTEAVAYEAKRSSRYLPALDPPDVSRWLGDPIEVDDPETVERIRQGVFFGSPSDPLKHLGESETLHVINTRVEFKEATWISDDKASLDLARHRGIPTMRTKDVMAVACVGFIVSQQEGFALLQQMVTNGRSIRLPATADDLMR
ncbi:hypothetical protein [Kitasatospora sp. NBC_01300]|uniref:hypothetical protein n=1 Tax=Kitasatospora sp. NBC_01300 TaxID=2903574 RepID=UPI00352F595A|nr:hypothetical protein OG556_03935 [Kitasatospora sp. NBC_01300]